VAAVVIDDRVLPMCSVAEWLGVPYLVTHIRVARRFRNACRIKGRWS
jgi:hypothetical protein